jgi:4a-hydroxytetrahydrobiopterin dehydratase
MDDLTKKRCIPCEGGFPALTRDQVSDYTPHIPEWQVNADATAISRTFKFADFKEALEFTNRVGELAQEEWHHPDIALGWGKVGITLTTHAVKGLSENDFILAAKIDQIS